MRIKAAIDKVPGGMAASSTAGNASAVPMAVAAVYTGYTQIAATATLQVTAAVIVTAILPPLLTTWLAKRVQNRRSFVKNAVVKE